jgi:hypothetical protein
MFIQSRIAFSASFNNVFTNKNCILVLMLFEINFTKFQFKNNQTIESKCLVFAINMGKNMYVIFKNAN